MKRLLWILLSTVAYAQGPTLPFGFVPSASAGTFTVIQSPNAVAITNATSVTLSLTQTTAAGNLFVFIGQLGSNSLGTTAIPTTLNAGGTLINAPSCMSDVYNIVAYVLPSTSTAVATSLVMNFNVATTGEMKFYELHPSASGANVGLDNCQTVANASSASPVGPTFVTSGTNDGFVQGLIGNSPTVLTGTGYTNKQFTGPYAFGAAASPGANTPPTWTQTAAASWSTAAAFGWNVPAGSIDGTFNDFESGVAGNNPALADLVASMHGSQGWSYVAGATLMKYSTAASMPLLNTTARFYGDGATYASGSGTKGFLTTWNGSTTTDTVKMVMTTSGSTGSLPIVVTSIKYNDNFPAADTSAVDCVQTHGNTDFSAPNCYGGGGSRFFRLETPAGNGSSFNASGGTLATWCGTSAGQGCTIQVQYDTGGGGITASAVTVAVSGGTATWTGTFTASQWPLGWAFSPSGCTLGTNLNGQLFYVVSATSTTLITSSTGYTNGGTTAVATGPATTCTLTGQHVMSVCSDTGVLEGVSFHAGSASLDYPQSAGWGDFGAGNTPTNGKTSQWDSFMFFPSGAQAIPCNPQVL